MAESECCKGFAHYARSEDHFSTTDTMNREVGEGANSGRYRTINGSIFIICSRQSIMIFILLRACCSGALLQQLCFNARFAASAFYFSGHCLQCQRSPRCSKSFHTCRRHYEGFSEMQLSYRFPPRPDQGEPVTLILARRFGLHGFLSSKISSLVDLA